MLHQGAGIDEVLAVFGKGFFMCGKDVLEPKTLRSLCNTGMGPVLYDLDVVVVVDFDKRFLDGRARDGRTELLDALNIL